MKSNFQYIFLAAILISTANCMEDQTQALSHFTVSLDEPTIASLLNLHHANLKNLKKKEDRELLQNELTKIIKKLSDQAHKPSTSSSRYCQQANNRNNI